MDGQPVLRLGVDGQIELRPLNAASMDALGCYVRAGGSLQSLLRVSVVGSDTALPPMLGRYETLADGIRFVPAFPFERRSVYRASFDPRPLRHSDDVLTLEFSRPLDGTLEATAVTGIYPSGDELPENLLRFYVEFSGPMQRGHARSEIVILGPDGAVVPDVLYRAPVELWDREMRRLTVLLDPGRLKRGVGPNRALGPPLVAGELYTLMVGAEMTDLMGRPLTRAVCKRFRTTPPIRDPIPIEQWQIEPPETGSRDPLIVRFPQPLDRGSLSHALSVASLSGRSIAGRVDIGRNETQWGFIPTLPWVSASYHLHVDTDLEDVCGNTIAAAFDRSMREREDGGGGTCSIDNRRSFAVAEKDL